MASDDKCRSIKLESTPPRLDLPPTWRMLNYCYPTQNAYIRGNRDKRGIGGPDSHQNLTDCCLDHALSFQKLVEIRTELFEIHVFCTLAGPLYENNVIGGGNEVTWPGKTTVSLMPSKMKTRSLSMLSVASIRPLNAYFFVCSVSTLTLICW